MQGPCLHQVTRQTAAALAKYATQTLCERVPPRTDGGRMRVVQRGHRARAQLALRLGVARYRRRQHRLRRGGAKSGRALSFSSAWPTTFRMQHWQHVTLPGQMELAPLNTHAPSANKHGVNCGNPHLARQASTQRLHESRRLA